MKKLFLSIVVLIAVRTATAQSVLIEAPVTADTALSVHNKGTGPVGSFITRNTDNTGALIYGDHYGKGGGVRMRLMNAQNNNPGIYISNIGQGSSIFSSSNKSKAGEFYANAGNADTAVSIKHDGTGMGLNVEINNVSSVGAALSVKTKGDGTVADLNLNNTGSNSNELNVTSQGLGYVATFNTFNSNSNSSTVKVNNTGTGNALEVQMLNSTSTASAVGIVQSGNGTGLKIELPISSGARGIEVLHDGVGPGIFSTSKGGHAIWGITSSISAAAILGYNTFGEAVVGQNRGGDGVGAVVGRNDSSGYGIRGFNTKNGIGVLGQSGISGGTGVGGRFENVNSVNPSNVLEAVGNGTGASLFVRNTNLAATNLAIFKKIDNNVARINDAGKGFFNGGTQSSGADMAEAFDVTGNINNYEPGDVLMIATDKDRTVTKSGNAYSDLVVGVYATKPGMLMTEENIDTDISDKVPMGVVGVIPTKVCLEGGEIIRGDMLVTSSVPGVAMKADKTKIKTGQCIGKALENFNEEGIGKIKVFVNVK